jgi:hypothetical protein
MVHPVPDGSTQIFELGLMFPQFFVSRVFCVCVSDGYDVHQIVSTVEVLYVY